MLNKDEYVGKVWQKYNEYCAGNLNDNFYNEKIPPKEEPKSNNKFLRIVAMLILSITLTVGGVYAGIIIYNNYINSEYIDNSNNYMKVNWMKQNMDFTILETNIYFKDIETYGEYLKYKENISELEELKESDFESNFAVIVCGKINIEGIETNDEILKINVRVNMQSKKQNICTVLVPNEKRREKIELARLDKEINSKNMAIEDITINYTKEQAIQDGYIVIENNQDEVNIISNNENDIYDFIKKTKEGEDSDIRIIVYYGENLKEQKEIEIKDIKYNNGIYLYSARSIYKDNHDKITDKNSKFNDIIMNKSKEKNQIILYNKDEKKRIFIIKF